MTHIGCTCDRLREAEEKAAKWDAIVRCRDCENASHFFPYSWNGERSTIEIWTCRILAEGEEIDPDGFCAWGERRADG